MCYIIGPIRSKWGLIGRLINVWRGRQAAVKLWKAGFAVICPHVNSLTIAMVIPDEDEIVKLDLEIIKRCDFIVVLEGWGGSKGSRVELAFCHKIKSNVYHNVLQAINDEIIW